MFSSRSMKNFHKDLFNHNNARNAKTLTSSIITVQVLPSVHSLGICLLALMECGVVGLKVTRKSQN